MTTTELVDVTIEPRDNGLFCVSAIWSNVDRPNVGGIVHTLSVCQRIKKAMLDGKWFTDVSVMTDINGDTYANARDLTIGKYANADLRKIGY